MHAYIIKASVENTGKFPRVSIIIVEKCLQRKLIIPKRIYMHVCVYIGYVCI